MNRCGREKQMREEREGKKDFEIRSRDIPRKVKGKKKKIQTKPLRPL